MLQESPQVFSYANYMIELSLLEPAMLRYPPSTLAAAAIYLAIKLLKPG